MVVTGMAVFAGLGFGLRALSLAKTHPQASSLKLVALNLLEPSVTMMVLFVVFVAAGGMQAEDESIFVLPVIGAVPFTWMLLAPIWTRVTHPIRTTVMVYGVLRWLNTVAFWMAGVMALKTSNNDLVMLASVLIVSGTLILCLSATHLASSLSDFHQLRSTHS
jgi:hypothetical protein